MPDEYIAEVSRFFDATTDKLFSKADFNANFDYHAQRRALAQEVCAAYTAKLNADPSYRKVLYNELADYWHRNNKKDRGKLEPLSYFDKPYKLRGPNREKALKMGYPTEYDRLALRATSVFHLAHWRDDVSVASYVTAR